MPARIRATLYAVAICNLGLAASTAAQTSRFQNLHVLPADITRDSLNAIMLDNLRGLGLPRLAGEGCLYCHVGDLDVPRREWDYASDAKPEKQKARVMLRMVRDINEQHLTQLKTRVDPAFRVSCFTCHKGRTDPRPLDTILMEAYEEDGLAGLSTRYHALRERFFGSDAYDFRPGTLTGIASTLMDRGNTDDAVAVAALNRDANTDDVGAARAWVQLRLLRTVITRHVDAALTELDSLAPTLGAGVMSPDVLDGIAWGLIRSPRDEDGKRLVQANYARFPNAYRAIESMAFVLDMENQKAEAIALIEAWLAQNPDHARAQRLLVNMRR